MAKKATLKKKKPYVPPYLRDEKLKILVFTEKHSRRYFTFRNREDLVKIADKIVDERTGLWYSQEEVDADESRDNWEFLQYRADWEYEGFDIEYPENE